MSPCSTPAQESAKRPQLPLYITDLGASAGYFVWGMRACIRGQSNDPVVERAFAEVFESDAASILADIHALAALIGKSARHRPTVGSVGCARLTPHEISMVSMLSSAQSANTSSVEAHLAWMVTPKDRAVLKVLIQYIADRFTCHGLAVEAPSPPAPPTRATPLFIAGTGPSQTKIGRGRG